MYDGNSGDGTGVSRRKLIATGAGATAGVAGLLAIPGAVGTAAGVELDTVDVTGDSATLAGKPSEITLSVSGSWEITGPSTPEQCRVVCQVHHAGEADDMAEHVEIDSPASGDYSLSMNILNHRNLSASDVMPADSGGEKTTDIKVRVILLAINGGEIEKEAYAEDTATLTVTKDGMELSVSGAGDMTIIE